MDMKTFLVVVFFMLILKIEFCKPIVLIPGLSGSALTATLHRSRSVLPFYCRKHGSFRVWLSYDEMLPGVNCFTSNMAMEYDPENDEYANAPGVKIEPIGWGGVDGIDYLDYIEGFGVPGSMYFRPLVDLLESKGYKVGENLFAAPYDWRVPPNKMYGKFGMTEIQKLIETAYEKNNRERVVLIVHSMGNTHMSWFLNKEVSMKWKEKYIDRYVALSAPFAGAPGILRAILSGSNDQFKVWGISIISLEATKMCYRTWGSFSALLPHEESVYGNGILLKLEDGSSSQNFTMSQIREVLELTSSKNMPIMYDNEEEMRNFAVMDPGVPVYCMYSLMGPNSTERAFVYKKSSGNDAFLNQPQIIFGEGDGTVNIESLRYCENWNSTKTVKTVKGVTHKRIVQDPEAIKIIWELVNDMEIIDDCQINNC